MLTIDEMALVFHKLVSLEEAIRIIDEKLEGIKPIGVELVPLSNAYGRILAEDVYARIDSPPFDRSTVDGYAVVAEDTYNADEANPAKLKLIGKAKVGEVPSIEVSSGTCVEISTGTPLPRGANAAVMVEYTKVEEGVVLIYKAVSPGENIAQTGSDASIGDLVFRKGRKLGARELGALAAIGYSEVKVYLTPRVALFSIGGELTPVSEKLEPGKIYDVNSHAISAMLKDLGVRIDFHGILPDDYTAIKKSIEEALEEHDVVITSGSTSAGFGDVIYRVFEELGGVIIHGLKVKPGKPTVIGATRDRKLLIGLPGFPLSAMMMFTALARPIIMKMMGVQASQEENTVKAKIPIKIETGKGKRHFVPVQILTSKEGLIAYPVTGDSGAATALSIADGFVEVEEEKQYISEDEEVVVKLFQPLKISSLSIVGSNCPALSILLDEAGLWDAKQVNVGSLSGWRAIKRGEADIAGTHLLDPETRQYNTHMPSRMDLEKEVEIYRGYVRTIGFVVQRGNPKNIKKLEDVLRDDVIFINRVKGSGVRTFIDIMLEELGVKDPGKKIRGYSYGVKTHTAVAASVSQGRADVGIAVGYVAELYGLEFIPLAEEYFDFVIRKDRLEKDSIKKFIKTLGSEPFHKKIREIPYYKPCRETGQKIFG